MSGEPNDTKWKVDGYDKNITTKKYGDSTLTIGGVGSKWGFVIVNSWKFGNGEKSTRLEFIHNGYNHTRIIDNTYTDRGLVTVARRYAKAIVEATQ